MTHLKKDLLIIHGDWNAKVRKHTQRNGCVGQFGISDMNDRVQILLEFAEKYKLVIANTVYYSGYQY